MNAFSPDYVAPGFDEFVKDVKRSKKASESNSEKRAKQLASPDPKVRAKAIHNLGDLSVKLNKKIFNRF